MLIYVLNIKLTCEWHKVIKLNYKNSRTTVLRFPRTLRRSQLCLYLVTSELPCCKALVKVTAWRCLAAGHAQWTSMASRSAYSTWTPRSQHFSMAIISVTVKFCHMCVGLYLYILTYGTLSRSSDLNSWDTLYVSGVTKPMSQTFPVYSPTPLKQKSSYQHGSKSEQVPRYRLPSMYRYRLSITQDVQSADHLPQHIRCDVASWIPW
jgi:hypothetical protein